MALYVVHLQHAQARRIMCLALHNNYTVLLQSLLDANIVNVNQPFTIEDFPHYTLTYRLALEKKFGKRYTSYHQTIPLPTDHRNQESPLHPRRHDTIRQTRRSDAMTP